MTKFGVFITCILCSILCFPTNVSVADEPQIKFYGNRKFRVSGPYISLMFATETKVFVYSQDGEISAFELNTGELTDVAYAKLPERQLMAGAALSPRRDVFAITYGRVIEIRKMDDPRQVVRSIDLPAFDSVLYPYATPTAEINFDEKGDRIYAFDQDTWVSYGVADGKLLDIPEDFSFTFVERLAKTGSGFLVDQGKLFGVDLNGKLSQRPVIKIAGHEIDSFSLGKDSIYIVGKVTQKQKKSTNLLELLQGPVTPYEYVLFEYDATNYKEKQRWNCDSTINVTLKGRPIFRKGNVIVRGMPNGQTKELVKTNDEIDHFFVSPDEKYLLGLVSGGLRCWDTETWTPVSGVARPLRDERTFSVNDNGELIALTDSSLYKSNVAGLLDEIKTFRPPLSPMLKYRSLSADGTKLAYIRKNVGAFRLDLADNQTTENKPVKLKLPNNAVPRGVFISDNGNHIGVQYNPKISLDDQNQKLSEEEAREAFRKGFAEGFGAGLGEKPGIPQLKESCAIFKLNSTKPDFIGKIGENAMIMSGDDSPYLDSKTNTVYWAASHHVGRWNFSAADSKPTARSTGRGEVNGSCAFNKLGDVVFRKVNLNGPPEILGQVYWLGSEKKWPRRLATQQLSRNQVYIVALPDDGQHVYLGKSEGFTSTITKIKIVGKEAVWKIELPSRLEKMQLSPNNKFLGAKLSDSRYVVISKLDSATPHR